MAGELPVVLLSGMAADERLFAPQTAALPNVRVAAWIQPRPRVGRPSIELLRSEQERRKPDAVSAERERRKRGRAGEGG